MAAMELFRVAARMVLDKSDFDKGASDADKTGKSLADNLSNYMSKAKKIITGLFAAAAIKKAASAVWDLAKETSAAGDRIDKQSQALGLSRKAYQEWDYILGQSGASIDSMGMSMKTMTEAISENGKETAVALSQLGLSAAQLQNLSTEEQFEKLVRAFQKIPAGADKSQLAMKLFGRSAQSLMPLLNSSTDSIDELRKRAQELGLIMSDEDVDASVAFGDALDDLTKTTTALKMKFGAQLLPGLTKGLISAASSFGRITNSISAAFKTGDWSGVFSTITEEIKAAVPGMIDTVVKVAKGLFENADKLVSLAASIITGLASGLAAEIPTLVAKLPTILKTVKETLVTLAETFGNAAIDAINAIFGTNIPHIDKLELPSPEEIGKKISAWWDGGNGIKKLIQDACTWVLNLFGLPAETNEKISKYVSDWWGGIVSFVVDACQWVLGLFGFPTKVDTNKLKADAEKWFSGFSGILIEACNWVLSLFGLPKVDTEKLKKDVGTWFDGIVSFVVDACQWVLGLFGLPSNVDTEKLKGDVEKWFAGFSGVLIDACNWVLNLFGLPTVDTEKLKKDVGTWFDGMVSTIVDACQWVLGLFGLPSNVDTNKLKNDVTNWFSGLSNVLIEACNWVINLFGLPKVDTEKLKKDVGNWFDGLVGTIQAACSWVLGLFGVPTDNKKDISETVGKWWSGVKGLVIGACKWVLALFGFPEEKSILTAVKKWWSGSDGNGGIRGMIVGLLKWTLGELKLPDWSEIVNKITTWWNDVLKHLSLGFGANFHINGQVDENGNVTYDDEDGTKGGYGSKDGSYSWHSFAKGSNYIPYDGFKAELHRGEEVLTATQARQRRESIGFNASDLNRAVASAVAAAVSNIQINMNGKRVADAVSQYVSQNIYQNQYGRRFVAE